MRLGWGGGQSQMMKRLEFQNEELFGLLITNSVKGEIVDA